MPGLSKAKAAAAAVVEELATLCDRLVVAGSIRRGAPSVKDIEPVANPEDEPRPAPGTMFNIESTDLLDQFLEHVVSHGRHKFLFRPQTYRGRTAPWGSRQKKLWLHHEGIDWPVDLFIVTPETWASQLIIRTGPAEFCARLVKASIYGGAMPPSYRQLDGRLQKVSGWDHVREREVYEPLDTPTEEAYFAALSLPAWRPEERDERTLYAWLIEHKRITPKRSSEARPYAPFRTRARGPSARS